MILKAKSSSKEEDEPEPEPDDKETRSIADSSKDSDDDEDAEGKHGAHWLNLTQILGPNPIWSQIRIKNFRIVAISTLFWELYNEK